MEFQNSFEQTFRWNFGNTCVFQIARIFLLHVLISHQPFQNDSMTSKKEVVSNRRNRTAVTVFDFIPSLLQTTTSASLILLKPLSSKALHTKAIARNKVCQPIQTMLLIFEWSFCNLFKMCRFFWTNFDDPSCYQHVSIQTLEFQVRFFCGLIL